MVVECWTFTADVELRGNAEGWLWRLTLVALSRTHKFSLAFSTMRSCGREGELFVSLRTKSLRSSAVWDANCVVSGLYLISPSPAKSRRNGQMKKNLHSIRALFIYSFHKRSLNNFSTSLISLKRGFRASLWKKKRFIFFSEMFLWNLLTEPPSSSQILQRPLWVTMKKEEVPITPCIIVRQNHIYPYSSWIRHYSRMAHSKYLFCKPSISSFLLFLPLPRLPSGFSSP